jgi:L-rhamnose isomerase
MDGIIPSPIFPGIIPDWTPMGKNTPGVRNCIELGRNSLNAPAVNPTTYTEARETYAAWGVDTEAALSALASSPISLQCWQGDDVGGFERSGATLDGGGIQVTGTHPGKARSLGELREDLDAALGLIPGPHRVNLHASYGEFGGRKVERNEVEPSHFAGWIEWARERGLGLDFNPTFFSHPLAADGFTLSSRNPAVRRFWIEHGIACRRIGAALGGALGTPAVTNLWIPDGCKDTPADRRGPRERLHSALDEVFREPIDPRLQVDAIESKLFGIGSESYTVGSHEFYLGYAVRNGKHLCLDMGHFHPTESVADKISSILGFVPGILLHLSRGVRWDSDHVVLYDDPTRAVLEEVVRGGYLGRTLIGLDYFDASINRVGAWVIGARNARKCLLWALLEPRDLLLRCEESGDLTGRLAALEESKVLPLGAVWEEFCRREETPGDGAWIERMRRHELDVQSRRI